MDAALIVGVVFAVAFAAFIAYRILRAPNSTGTGTIPRDRDNSHPR